MIYLLICPFFLFVDFPQLLVSQSGGQLWIYIYMYKSVGVSDAQVMLF